MINPDKSRIHFLEVEFNFYLRMTFTLYGLTNQNVQTLIIYIYYSVLLVKRRWIKVSIIRILRIEYNYVHGN